MLCDVLLCFVCYRMLLLLMVFPCGHRDCNWNRQQIPERKRSCMQIVFATMVPTIQSMYWTCGVLHGLTCAVRTVSTSSLLHNWEIHHSVGELCLRVGTVLWTLWNMEVPSLCHPLECPSTPSVYCACSASTVFWTLVMKRNRI